MVELKKDMEDVEKVMRVVQTTTSCVNAEDVYPR